MIQNNYTKDNWKSNFIQDAPVVYTHSAADLFDGESQVLEFNDDEIDGKQYIFEKYFNSNTNEVKFSIPVSKSIPESNSFRISNSPRDNKKPQDNIYQQLAIESEVEKNEEEDTIIQHRKFGLFGKVKKSSIHDHKRIAEKVTMRERLKCNPFSHYEIRDSKTPPTSKGDRFVDTNANTPIVTTSQNRRVNFDWFPRFLY